MCKSIQTTYKFCGCPGEFYQQTCPKPTRTCHLLLNNPITLPLTCYCDAHSSQTFKTVRQDRRDTARFNKEYNKILDREEEAERQQTQDKRSRGRQLQTQQRQQTEQFRPVSGERSVAAKEREEQNASIRQDQRDIADFRHREREMEAYGRKWGKRAMRRKYPVARQRAMEEAERRKAGGQEGWKGSWAGRGKVVGWCCVM